MDQHSRRDVFRIAAAAAAAAVPVSAQEVAPVFFTPAEFRMLDELSEIIIPADEHSPGARAAKCAAYIDKTLAESLEDKPRDEFREGLAVVDKLSNELHHASFLDSTPEQRVAVVTRMARAEKDPKKPEELFFIRLKGRTAHAYYTSEIGIHQEIGYKGNVLLNQFEGFDAGLVPITPAESSK